jgi:quinol monooxygenase YgiN
VAKEMIEKSNKESGCKSYQLYQDPYNSTMFIFVEEYKNQAAIDAHFASDYFKAFGPKISSLVKEPAKIKIITVAKEVNQ